MFFFGLACEYNVHKGNCFEAIEECPGPKKKRVSKQTVNQPIQDHLTIRVK